MMSLDLFISDLETLASVVGPGILAADTFHMSLLEEDRQFQPVGNRLNIHTWPEVPA